MPSQVCQEPRILRSPKRCSCGITHVVAPAGARICSASHLWFECACGSTLCQQSDAFVAAKLRAQGAQAELQRAQAALEWARSLVG